jgi:ketol-acid reductoisomerase
MIGCGSMGGGLALLFAENGVNVALSDPSEETMDEVIEKAEKSGYHNKVHKYKGNWTRGMVCELKLTSERRLQCSLCGTIATSIACIFPSPRKCRRQGARRPDVTPHPG